MFYLKHHTVDGITVMQVRMVKATVSITTQRATRLPLLSVSYVKIENLLTHVKCFQLFFNIVFIHFEDVDSSSTQLKHHKLRLNKLDQLRNTKTQTGSAEKHKHMNWISYRHR